MIKAYFESSCEPNKDGGLMVYETFIYKDGTEIHSCYEIYERKDKIASNHIAEYCGLIAIFKYLLANNIEHEEIIIYSDSQIIANQMNKIWSIKNGKYKQYAEHALSLSNRLRSNNKIIFEWKQVKKRLLSIHKILGKENHEGVSCSTRRVNEI